MDGLAKLQALSTATFASLGLSTIAYVKRMELDGAPVYAIHAADGRYIWHSPDRALAIATVQQHQMAVVSVH